MHNVLTSRIVVNFAKTRPDSRADQRGGPRFQGSVRNR